MNAEQYIEQEPADLLELFPEDDQQILYRPAWRNFTDSVTAVILLGQIFVHWKQNGCQPFYKFKEPCQHPQYKAGESWTEELGFSRKEFDTALRKIGYKKSRKHNEPHDCPVEYWTDISRLTYYTIHPENLYNLLKHISADTTAPLSQREVSSRPIERVAQRNFQEHPAAQPKVFTHEATLKPRHPVPEPGYQRDISTQAPMPETRHILRDPQTMSQKMPEPPSKFRQKVESESDLSEEIILPKKLRSNDDLRVNPPNGSTKRPKGDLLKSKIDYMKRIKESIKEKVGA